MQTTHRDLNRAPPTSSFPISYGEFGGVGLTLRRLPPLLWSSTGYTDELGPETSGAYDDASVGFICDSSDQIGNANLC